MNNIGGILSRENNTESINDNIESKPVPRGRINPIIIYALSVEPGQLWKHFKGGVCEIITVATHSETDEQMVVYKCDACVTDDCNGVWVRPMSMFASLVDKEKYPDAKQDYRFELMSTEIINMEDKTERRV